MDDELLRHKWDRRYGGQEAHFRVAEVVTQNLHLLPRQGRALDLACGLGGNALALAERGLTVEAWDLSPVAIDRLRREAARRGLAVGAEVRDVVRQPPGASSFDLITVAHFLERDLVPALIEALRPRGLICYQTFVRDAVTDSGPSNPVYRLAENELLRLFRNLTVRLYREEGSIGDLTQGIRNQALLVAQKT